ncbi:MAG: alkaline phosphatase family protein, partial [Candidatus Izimaplasma sp.]|nr:alkaline phosphatase family protein [Candidatus Izimaplasma bacterium]
VIYILLDGMGTNLIKNLLKEEDSLSKYMHKEITSVFPPTTVAATDAVLSGVPPIVNGHLGWVQYFEKEDINLVIFQNFDFYDNERIPNEDLRSKYLSFDRIGDQDHRHNPNVVTNELFPAFIENGSATFNEEIERVLLITHNTDKSFNYLYWTEPDLIEHKTGIYSEETKDMMQNLNNDFTELIENISDDTIVICIADHGLTNIIELPLFDNKKLLSMLKRLPSIEPRAINFFVKEGLLHEFKNLFNKHYSKYYKLYTKQEILKSKLFGVGKPHKLIDMFLGDYIALAIDKYMFTLGNGKGYIAHHAGMSQDEMMVPLIIYSKK